MRSRTFRWPHCLLRVLDDRRFITLLLLHLHYISIASLLHLYCISIPSLFHLYCLSIASPLHLYCTLLHLHCLNGAAASSTSNDHRCTALPLSYCLSIASLLVSLLVFLLPLYCLSMSSLLPLYWAIASLLPLCCLSIASLYLDCLFVVSLFPVYDGATTPSTSRTTTS
jgi:hypothetical protein